MFEVRNGNRTLRFEGRLLASASSKRRDASRWIEFDLYKTSAGTYVLSRVGVSLIFHSPLCPLVDRYGLHEASVDDLDPLAVECEECEPGFEDPIVYPEVYRYWTLTSEGPKAILDALYQRDKNGGKYLTRVSERLLQNAAAQDADIDMMYRFEEID